MSSLLYETRIFAWQAGKKQRCFIIGPIFCFFKDHFVIQVLWIVMGTKKYAQFARRLVCFFLGGLFNQEKRLMCTEMIQANFGIAFVSSTA